ncbi:MAG: carbamoyl-phosphate synthase large subunit [Actinomycetes bacterium]|jgi:carbamoyl-phosphate synthase large subunit|nr:carbamoyl-phosphate synthase large subunit [Actinomycetes bacterium]
MPKRTDIKKILVIGSGPIVIGQACEFDYSGAQACKVLRDDGYEVVLINSNPATIMTDPELAERTYIEPITPEFVEKIIIRENIDAMLPTLGGQTGLNCAMECAKAGILDRHGVELLGAQTEVIERGEDRKLFAMAMENIGLEVPRSGYVYSMDDARRLIEDLGYPVVLRPSFTMGGAGGGIAYNADELRDIVSNGLDLSPINEVLMEESVIGWKEFEMEVMRDCKDNAVIVCSIENLDPMGVHTGDSITVAPIQTLSDVEYQRMRDASIAILREVGVETGGSNVQFAVNPADGRMVVIEMNPRVSRSSALASKATGFPIAKIAAKLAVGYTLDEISNDITRETPACFEPSIDYVVVKAPRFAFEKFEGTDETLTTRMKSVGEAMAIGRTFNEALGKALRSLEDGRAGLGSDGKDRFDEDHFDARITTPTAQRIYYVAEALRRGRSVAELSELSGIDPWFIGRIKAQTDLEADIKGRALSDLTADELRAAKRMGLSDVQIAYLTGTDEGAVRMLRHAWDVLPVFKAVDTCAAEFEAYTNYFYKCYDDEDEVPATDRPRAMILGAGPNRIGQGIEFDYCCVHAAYALHDEGFETVMVNCNPETVSTDYDTSDRLYFEPLTYEDVADVIERETPAGVVVTFGGQTPLKLAEQLLRDKTPIMGTQPDAIDLAEDRKRFSAVLDELGIAYPAAGTATTLDEAHEVADRIGYPLLVRPSYVLGGRGMSISYDRERLDRYMTRAARLSGEHPVLLDRFLEGAVEVDVDAVCDGCDVLIGGIMEHIEEAGIHSGDSACCIPSFTLGEATLDTIRTHTRNLALKLQVRGLMNIQYAVKDGVVYVLEVNPRASRTVPFVSKATGTPLAKVAARVMAGRTLVQQGLVDASGAGDVESSDQPDESAAAKVGEYVPTRYCVKEAVMPFGRFPGADTLLGPEMKSTGEVMGSAADFPTAYAKTQIAIDYPFPTSGCAFISVCDRDKRSIVAIARSLYKQGFSLMSTAGTARVLEAAGLPVRRVMKRSEGRPSVIDHVTNGEVQLIINTPFGQEARSDGYRLRSAAVRFRIPNLTNLNAASAFVSAVDAVIDGRLDISALQDYA